MRRLLIVMVLTGLLVGLAAQASAGVNAVPLVECPTQSAVANHARAVLPSLTTLAVASSLSPSLAAYTDRYGVMTVIGPRGWRCSAQAAVDGSEAIRVVPKGAALSSQEAIVADETSACYGCTTGQACGLFPAAARAYKTAYGVPCPVHRPARESLYRISSTIVAFEDPPYVKGDGNPSGGPYPANGVMTYVLPQHNQNGSYLETCTLPEAAHSTCTVILNDFIARYGKR